MLRLIRERRASTRAELMQITGLSRSTVSQRLDALLDQGLLVPVESASTGGRPPGTFAFNSGLGVILAADLGATHARLAVTDLSGTILAEVADERPIADGPDAVLDWLENRLDGLLAAASRPPDAVRGVGVGVPGPVEFAAGRPISPPIMPGWDRYPIADRLARRFGAPALVDNDVNIMALGECWAEERREDCFLFVKAGTGIGCGIVMDGRVHRGAQGAAGDIGHIRVPNHDDVICRCGRSGCLEAVAGGAALAANLRSMGIEANSTRDVVEHVRAGRPEAVRLVLQAGRELGTVLASVVNFFNPSLVIIGGDMADAHEHLLAGVRELTYQRSLPLATRDLRIIRSTLNHRAGVIGAAAMIIEHVLSPAAVDHAIAELRAA